MAEGVDDERNEGLSSRRGFRSERPRQTVGALTMLAIVSLSYFLFHPSSLPRLDFLS